MDLEHFTSHSPEGEPWNNLGKKGPLRVSSPTSASKPGLCQAFSSQVLNNYRCLVWSPLSEIHGAALSQAEQAQLSQLSLLCCVFRAGPGPGLAPDCQQVSSAGAPGMGCTTPDVAPQTGGTVLQEREEKITVLLHSNTEYLRQQRVNGAEIKFLYVF